MHCRARRYTIKHHSATAPQPTMHALKGFSPGSFIYYPAGQHPHYPQQRHITDHLSNVQMARRRINRGHAGRNPHFPLRQRPYGKLKGVPGIPIVEQSTAYLGKLHAHLTIMQPDAGYTPHVDAHDVAIIVLSGQIETLDQILKPHGVIYYSAGQPHGLRNIGAEPAQYLVFEFHAPNKSWRTRNNPRSTVRQRLANILSHFGVLKTARLARNQVAKVTFKGRI